MDTDENTIELHGVQVKFPCKPYLPQRLIMDRLIGAISTSTNALLESPTGTGKTLALLCGSCAFQQKMKKELLPKAPFAKGSTSNLSSSAPRYPPVTTSDIEDIVPNEKSEPNYYQKPKYYPRIFYLTRTHMQIKQIVEELKRTAYEPRMTILASRKQLCLKLHVRSSPNPGAECTKLCKQRINGCGYRRRVEKALQMKSISRGLWSLKDLISICREVGACPYFVAMEMLKKAELVLAPYNYIIDPTIRRVMGAAASPNDSILIFDEAHNIESTCRESVTYKFTRKELERACIEVNEMVERLDALHNLMNAKWRKAYAEEEAKRKRNERKKERELKWDKWTKEKRMKDLIEKRKEERRREEREKRKREFGLDDESVVFDEIDSDAIEKEVEEEERKREEKEKIQETIKNSVIDKAKISFKPSLKSLSSVPSLSSNSLFTFHNQNSSPQSTTPLLSSSKSPSPSPSPVPGQSSIFSSAQPSSSVLPQNPSEKGFFVSQFPSIPSALHWSSCLPVYKDWARPFGLERLADCFVDGGVNDEAEEGAINFGNNDASNGSILNQSNIVTLDDLKKADKDSGSIEGSEMSISSAEADQQKSDGEKNDLQAKAEQTMKSYEVTNNETFMESLMKMGNAVSELKEIAKTKKEARREIREKTAESEREELMKRGIFRNKEEYVDEGKTTNLMILRSLASVRSSGEAGKNDNGDDDDIECLGSKSQFQPQNLTKSTSSVSDENELTEEEEEEESNDEVGINEGFFDHSVLGFALNVMGWMLKRVTHWVMAKEIAANDELMKHQGKAIPTFSTTPVSGGRWMISDEFDPTKKVDNLHFLGEHGRFCFESSGITDQTLILFTKCFHVLDEFKFNTTDDIDEGDGGDDDYDEENKGSKKSYEKGTKKRRKIDDEEGAGDDEDDKDSKKVKDQLDKEKKMQFKELQKKEETFNRRVWATVHSFIKRKKVYLSINELLRRNQRLLRALNSEAQDSSDSGVRASRIRNEHKDSLLRMQKDLIDLKMQAGWLVKNNKDIGKGFSRDGLLMRANTMKYLLEDIQMRSDCARALNEMFDGSSESKKSDVLSSLNQQEQEDFDENDVDGQSVPLPRDTLISDSLLVVMEKLSLLSDFFFHENGMFVEQYGLLMEFNRSLVQKGADRERDMKREMAKLNTNNAQNSGASNEDYKRRGKKRVFGMSQESIEEKYAMKKRQDEEENDVNVDLYRLLTREENKYMLDTDMTDLMNEGSMNSNRADNKGWNASEKTESNTFWSAHSTYVPTASPSYSFQKTPSLFASSIQPSSAPHPHSQSFHPFRSISFIALSPSIAFHFLKTARSIILTSGTLAPFISFPSELSTVFSDTLQAPHVVDMQKQVLASAIPRLLPLNPANAELQAMPSQSYPSSDYSPSASSSSSSSYPSSMGRETTELCSTSACSQNESMIDRYGDAILSIATNVPHGMLVFFSSYNQALTYMLRWHRTKLLQKICDVKRVFVESKEMGEIAIGKVRSSNSKVDDDEFASLTSRLKGGSKAKLTARERGKLFGLSQKQKWIERKEQEKRARSMKYGQPNATEQNFSSLFGRTKRTGSFSDDLTESSKSLDSEDAFESKLFGDDEDEEDKDDDFENDDDTRNDEESTFLTVMMENYRHAIQISLHEERKREQKLNASSDAALSRSSSLSFNSNSDNLDDEESIISKTRLLEDGDEDTSLQNSLDYTSNNEDNDSSKGERRNSLTRRTSSFGDSRSRSKKAMQSRSPDPNQWIVLDKKYSSYSHSSFFSSYSLSNLIPLEGKGNAAGGALLFAICRGRISEGINFQDALCRCVVLMGVPYPAKNAPEVVLKKEYNQMVLEKTKKALSSSMKESKPFGMSVSASPPKPQMMLPLSGNEWYNLQALRASNQALGRVIRHRADYGAMIMLDSRYARPTVASHSPPFQRYSSSGSKSAFEFRLESQSQIRGGLSKWFLPYITDLGSVEELCNILPGFYQQARTHSEKIRKEMAMEIRRMKQQAFEKRKEEMNDEEKAMKQTGMEYRKENEFSIPKRNESQIMRQPMPTMHNINDSTSAGRTAEESKERRPSSYSLLEQFRMRKVKIKADEAAKELDATQPQKSGVEQQQVEDAGTEENEDGARIKDEIMSKIIEEDKSNGIVGNNAMISDYDDDNLDNKMVDDALGLLENKEEEKEISFEDITRTLSSENLEVLSRLSFNSPSGTQPVTDITSPIKSTQKVSLASQMHSSFTRASSLLSLSSNKRKLSQLSSPLKQELQAVSDENASDEAIVKTELSPLSEYSSSTNLPDENHEAQTPQFPDASVSSSESTIDEASSSSSSSSSPTSPSFSPLHTYDYYLPPPLSPSTVLPLPAIQTKFAGTINALEQYIRYEMFRRAKKLEERERDTETEKEKITDMLTQKQLRYKEIQNLLECEREKVKRRKEKEEERKKRAEEESKERERKEAEMLEMAKQRQLEKEERFAKMRNAKYLKNFSRRSVGGLEILLPPSQMAQMGSASSASPNSMLTQGRSPTAEPTFRLHTPSPVKPHVVFPSADHSSEKRTVDSEFDMSHPSDTTGTFEGSPEHGLMDVKFDIGSIQTQNNGFFATNLNSNASAQNIDTSSITSNSEQRASIQSDGVAEQTSKPNKMNRLLALKKEQAMKRKQQAERSQSEITSPTQSLSTPKHLTISPSSSISNTRPRFRLMQAIQQFEDNEQKKMDEGKSEKEKRLEQWKQSQIEKSRAGFRGCINSADCEFDDGGKFPSYPTEENKAFSKTLSRKSDGVVSGAFEEGEDPTETEEADLRSSQRGRRRIAKCYSDPVFDPSSPLLSQEATTSAFSQVLPSASSSASVKDMLEQFRMKKNDFIDVEVQSFGSKSPSPRISSPINRSLMPFSQRSGRSSQSPSPVRASIEKGSLSPSIAIPSAILSPSFDIRPSQSHNPPLPPSFSSQSYPASTTPFSQPDASSAKNNESGYNASSSTTSSSAAPSSSSLHPLSPLSSPHILQTPPLPVDNPFSPRTEQWREKVMKSIPSLTSDLSTIPLKTPSLDSINDSVVGKQTFTIHDDYDVGAKKRIASEMAVSVEDNEEAFVDEMIALEESLVEEDKLEKELEYEIETYEKSTLENENNKKMDICENNDASKTGNPGNSTEQNVPDESDEMIEEMIHEDEEERLEILKKENEYPEEQQEIMKNKEKEQKADDEKSKDVSEFNWEGNMQLDDKEKELVNKLMIVMKQKGVKVSFSNAEDAQSCNDTSSSSEHGFPLNNEEQQNFDSSFAPVKILDSQLMNDSKTSSAQNNIKQFQAQFGLGSHNYQSSIQNTGRSSTFLYQQHSHQKESKSEFDSSSEDDSDKVIPMHCLVACKHCHNCFVMLVESDCDLDSKLQNYQKQNSKSGSDSFLLPLWYLLPPPPSGLIQPAPIKQLPQPLAYRLSDLLASSISYQDSNQEDNLPFSTENNTSNVLQTSQNATVSDSSESDVKKMPRCSFVRDFVDLRPSVVHQTSQYVQLRHLLSITSSVPVSAAPKADSFQPFHLLQMFPSEHILRQNQQNDEQEDISLTSTSTSVEIQPLDSLSLSPSLSSVSSLSFQQLSMAPSIPVKSKEPQLLAHPTQPACQQHSLSKHHSCTVSSLSSYPSSCLDSLPYSLLTQTSAAVLAIIHRGSLIGIDERFPHCITLLEKAQLINEELSSNSIQNVIDESNELGKKIQMKRMTEEKQAELKSQLLSLQTKLKELLNPQQSMHHPLPHSFTGKAALSNAFWSAPDGKLFASIYCASCQSVVGVQQIAFGASSFSTSGTMNLQDISLGTVHFFAEKCLISNKVGLTRVCPRIENNITS
ncbi:putative DNA helicase required for mitotic chromosome segregation CHL1 [Monocercomonoides exilis]|uniref:putative DNA helicase required for mitotic chromosome segregation CHL1 n=1 Tax=Monocercomonoides exilis TaxID=2049356 RepID=UPI00355A613A|nr:putative DNA helicase required for mitotic chromosome segregation CHL1 [Monocercomonoides exilis]|eukprot:MONOS_405.1-p1 / transcript=MONOS_405.1 / gene=MONOS_405 / organism=Monocercomonoides_exilis_PA203 / gene_product=putative DNA helicase required for mitotic chromosome segregation CHL1 / transcript_product=putative DNA helicase required for mitotic chromosome segregation CHL1 / location=Mono_scaffold00006:259975-271830(-) / protein_length=3800 / sequence_SO=supercontig / SO=protein_coding / is_pseudo=false